MSFIIKPEYVEEVLDLLCGSNYSGKVNQNRPTVGPQSNMYKFFDRDHLTSEEIEKLEKHRT